MLGRSLGSGPSVDLASRVCVGALILQSPLASGLRVVAPGSVITRILQPWDPFNNLAKLGKVTCEALVIHGLADEVVPVANGQLLHERLAARGLAHDPLWVAGRGHNDMPELSCVERMRQMLVAVAARQMTAVDAGLGREGAPAAGATPAPPRVLGA